MDSRGVAPRPSTVQNMANILLVDRGSNPPNRLSVKIGHQILSTAARSFVHVFESGMITSALKMRTQSLCRIQPVGDLHVDSCQSEQAN